MASSMISQPPHGDAGETEGSQELDYYVWKENIPQGRSGLSVERAKSSSYEGQAG